MRIYWDYLHEALRFEDLTHLISLGVEVLPRRMSPSDLRRPYRYEDPETEYFVDWAKYITLPCNEVEEIRGVDFSYPDAISDTQWRLLNQHIDVLFVQISPKALEHVAAHFHGVVLQRVMGYQGRNLQEWFEAESVDLSLFNERVRYSPNLPMIVEREGRRIRNFSTPVPTTVSRSRVPFRWREAQSRRSASTVISYLDVPAMVEISDTFAPLTEHVEIDVLGKNTPHRRGQFNVIGSLPWHDYLEAIAVRRVHIETGINPYHLRFSPQEAALMGVPVLFLKDGGFDRYLSNYGYDDDTREALGCCKDVPDMCTRLNAIVDDMDALRVLSQSIESAASDITDKIRGEFETAIRELAAQIGKPLAPFEGYQRNRVARFDDSVLPDFEGQVSTSPIAATFDVLHGELIDGGLNLNHTGATTIVAGKILRVARQRNYGFSLIDSRGEVIPTSIASIAVGVWSGEHCQWSKAPQDCIPVQSGEDNAIEIRVLWNGVDPTVIDTIKVEAMDAA